MVGGVLTFPGFTPVPVKVRLGVPLSKKKKPYSFGKKYVIIYLTSIIKQQQKRLISTNISYSLKSTNYLSTILSEF